MAESKKLYELKREVKKLECETNEENQKEILKRISGLLITDFAIKINENTIIKPMLVEAYYYHKGKFEDENTYRESGQSNRFGKLFFHPKKYSYGVDICLSMSCTYFLSFLIKNAIIENINKEFYSQEAIYYYLENNADINELADRDNILIEKHCEYEIVYTVRKGLKKPFKDELLAALPIDKIKEYKFTPGESPTNIIRGYICEKLSAGNLDEKEEHRLKELACGFVAWDNFKEC